MVNEKEESTDWRNDNQEKEVYHENICKFMRKVQTEEIFALSKEEESKIFNISFIDKQKKNTIESIFAKNFRNSIIEEYFEE